MNRRSRSSDAWRSSNAPSIWWSMPLSASPSRPASVDGGAASTRRERSPSAMASAVAVILLDRAQPEPDHPERHQAEHEQHGRAWPPPRPA